MTELRWNPILAEWVATAAHRRGRPVMPREDCPFCPGSGRVPEDYDVFLYPNDFPSFSSPPPSPSVQGTKLSPVRASAGACDVVLYHPDHKTALSQLPIPHLVKLVGLWKRRFLEHKRNPALRYVLIFENRGEVIGVTMPHPHGQIYAFPYVPPRLEREIASARSHFRRKRRGLFCDVLREERKARKRIVARNRHFTAFIPFFARWPYEVHVYSRRHLGTLEHLTRAEQTGLAEILKWVTLKYDNLWNIPFPYMMLFHQAPLRGPYRTFHFHIEFYPPLRGKEQIKYLASCEMGGGTFLNDAVAEETALELAETYPRNRKDL